VLQGIALALRPTPGGEIDFAIIDALTRSIGFVPIGFVPIGFVAIVVLAGIGDFWLYRTQSGLTARAAGLDETATRRIGAPATWIHVRAFVLSAALAALGGLFLAAQFGVGTADPGVVSKFALTSIAAAVLGGASLAGGKGSFVGAVLGAVFLSLIVNILPFLGWSASLEQISIGALTLVALVLYQRADLWTLLRARFARRALPARS
jgi:ribose transport system ATP-binding protein